MSMVNVYKILVLNGGFQPDNLTVTLFRDYYRRFSPDEISAYSGSKTCGDQVKFLWQQEKPKCTVFSIDKPLRRV